MNTRRSLRPTSTGIALVVALAAVLVPATAAYAGSAFAGTGYDGASLHGRYTVQLIPGCSEPDVGYCTPASSVSIDLYTHPQPGSGCKASGYEFDPTTIKPDGSFSATGQFSSGSPQLTFTVQGTFLSLGSVHGTITGNHGCGTDPFTINLRPAPLISTPPCMMLIEVHAARIILGGLVHISSGTFDAAGGTCGFGSGVNGLGGGFRFIVASTAAAADSGMAALMSTTSGLHQKPVAGLGAGATLYYGNAYDETTGKHTASITQFEVEFHRSGVWASLTVNPGVKACHTVGVPCPPTPTPVFSPSGFAVRERHVVEVAKALRSLL